LVDRKSILERIGEGAGGEGTVKMSARKKKRWEKEEQERLSRVGAEGPWLLVSIGG